MIAWQIGVRLQGDATNAPLDNALERLLRDWIVWPRLAAGILVGASLGVAGALMQLITRNPLVSPDLLGITAGAQLGLILGTTLPAAMGLPLIMVGGVAAAGLTFAAAGGGLASPLRLTLAGVGIAQCLSALIALLLSLNDRAAMVVSLWNTGSLSQFGWRAMVPSLVLTPLALLGLLALARPLNLAPLGDAQMRSLGVSPPRLKVLVVGIGSVLTALAFQLAGPLGFIGLVAPNLLRLGLGVARPSTLLPLCAVWGAALTLFADNAASTMAEWSTWGNGVTVPLGVLSALLGSLAILVLLRIVPAAPATALTQTDGRSLRQWVSLMRFAAITVAATTLLIGVGVFHATGMDPLAYARALAAGDAQAWALADLRLPRLLVDAMAGACLALSGVILQTVTRNPLAGPEILGVSQSAALAVLLALVLMPDVLLAWRFPIAWGGAALALAIVVGLNLRHGLEPLRLTLTGFALSGAALALIGLLIAQFSTNVAQALIWMVGSSYGRDWGDVAAMLPWMATGMAACLLVARGMDLLQLGDGVAGSLGMPVARRRVLLVVLASFLVAVPVAVVGPVGFVGLLVPHGVRLLGFYRSRQRLWAAPLLGAALLVLADLLGHALMAPIDIPLGIATAALGTPCFLLLLARTHFRRGGAGA
ncbi:iron-hydroxamate ABC transporter permease [Pigmentiphaga litoralis]|uniref:iron ABC transporter permease n=1 Tax=Pigmentiphaga litoralis TaxID=516702 RepID=UPI0016789415|nr:iron ABC transporter permease [Pigmentiphaga litoralis]GGW99386.1 iron-hydroxamate ABC transporter permease [Pigmentiphaga litoralis]